VNIMELTAHNVNEIFLDCLFKDGELTDNGIKAQGVRTNVVFNPERLKSHEKDITDMLSYLPKEFGKSTGGGWSFLNMCVDKNDVLWTGEHATVDKLIVLGIAVGKVSFPFPRELWQVLPGSVPYVMVDYEN